jgi:thymidylate kinase
MNASVITAITSTFTDKRYMKPDLSVMLVLKDVNAKHRIAQRGELKNPDPFESKNDDFQQRVSDGYEAIAVEYNIDTVDASASIEEVHANIVAKIQSQI